MFEASEALQKMEGMKKMKSMSFHQYSWNSEVETTWISLIGWHHKTSTTELLTGVVINDVWIKIELSSSWSYTIQNHIATINEPKVSISVKNWRHFFKKIVRSFVDVPICHLAKLRRCLWTPRGLKLQLLSSL